MTDQEKQDILDHVQQLYTDACTGQQDKRERMKRCRDFKVGKQWDSDVREYRKSRRQHTLTINRILPTVMHICGVETDNKRDPRVVNLKAGTYVISKVLTSLALHAKDQSSGDLEFSQWFEDGVSYGEGDLLVTIDRTEDAKHGNLTLEKVNSFDVFWDPNAQEYDRNKTAEYVHYDKWESKEKLISQYPQYADELSEGFVDTHTSGIFKTLIGFLFKGHDSDGYSDVEGEPNGNRDKYRLKVTHTWYKTYKTVGVVYDTNYADEAPVQISDKKALGKARKELKNHPRFELYERVVPILNYAKWCGDLLLEHVENPFPFDAPQIPNKPQAHEGVMLFPLIPYNPYFENGYAFGIVENLTSIQEEHNAARSAILNIVGRLANVGWIVNKLSPAGRQMLEEFASKDGIAIEKDKLGGYVEKMEPTPPPTGYQYLAERSAQDLQEVANIRVERPEADKSRMSGYAIALKQQSAMTGTGVPFRNWDYSLRLTTQFLVEIIRNCGVYSDSEVEAIVDEADLIDAELMEQATEILRQRGIELPPPPQGILELLQSNDPAIIPGLQAEMEDYNAAQRDFDKVARDVARGIILTQIRDVKKGKYGVKIDQAANTPSVRMANFVELMEMHGALVKSGQPGVAREDLIQASDIPNKDQIKANMPKVA